MKRISLILFVSYFAMTKPALALFGVGDIVNDPSHMAETIAGWGHQAADMADQLSELKQQYDMLTNQYNQLMTTYKSMQGIRGMADLVNNPALRRYLPQEYQELLSQGYGDWQTIRNSARRFGLEDSALNGQGDIGRLFDSWANQTAINRSTAESAYNQASQRFNSLQELLDKVNDAPDDKDIQDLQARIQAENAMLQNETIKLAALAKAEQAQRDLAIQQANEIRMRATQGSPDRF